MATDNPTQREGVLVNPYLRLSEDQIKLIDKLSRELLEDPGVLCYNDNAAEAFKAAGATVEDAGDAVRIRIPSELIDKAIESAPSRVFRDQRDKRFLRSSCSRSYVSRRATKYRA